MYENDTRARGAFSSWGSLLRVFRGIPRDEGVLFRYKVSSLYLWME